MANVEDASCSLIMVIPNKECDDLPYPVIMFYQTSYNVVLQMEGNTYKYQEPFSHDYHNSKIVRVGDTILASAVESGIDENWCLLDNQLMCNAFINGKYLSNIIDSPGRKYIYVHFNAGVTYSNIIGELPG